MKYLLLLAVIPAVMLFGKVESDSNSFAVYENSITLKTDKEFAKKFNSLVSLFEQFSARNQKSVKMKMGEESYIKHIYYKEFRSNNTEVKYDLRVDFDSTGVRVTGNVYEYLLFNKRRTKFKLIEPIELSEIAGDERIISCNQFVQNEADRLYETLKMEFYTAE